MELNKLKVICGECQTEMVQAGSIKSRSVTDISFRCPNENCLYHLTGVRLRVEEAEG